MVLNLWEKVEWVREQPEHIRKRYVLLCLFVSMVFVVAVWLLSLKSSFYSARQDIPAVTEKGKELLPGDSVPSLNSLFEQNKPLDVNGQEAKTGQEYFNEQFQKSAQ